MFGNWTTKTDTTNTVKATEVSIQFSLYLFSIFHSSELFLCKFLTAFPCNAPFLMSLLCIGNDLAYDLFEFSHLGLGHHVPLIKFLLQLWMFLCQPFHFCPYPLSLIQGCGNQVVDESLGLSMLIILVFFSFFSSKPFHPSMRYLFSLIRFTAY